MKIVTVLKSGGEYLPEHVYRLQKQCEQWLPQYKFFCLSDVILKCNTIPLTEDLPGWWSKLELFKLSGPVLFFDLDTTIANTCEWLDNVKNQEFVIVRDAYRGKNNPKAMQSCIMYWSGDMSYVWNAYANERKKFKYRGDQDYLETVVQNATYFQDFTNSVLSYKADIRDGQYSKEDATIIYYHGKPRPWNVENDI